MREMAAGGRGRFGKAAHDLGRRAAAMDLGDLAFERGEAAAFIGAAGVEIRLQDAARTVMAL